MTERTDKDSLTVEAAPQPQKAAPVAVPAGNWEGAEEWMPLAWELCANECGEEACTELVWEGGPIPEPWGDRWLKYEDQAKEMIALVRKLVPSLAASPQAAPAQPQQAAPAFIAESEIAYRLRIARLLAEMHGEELLSEQQCARYAGVDLVSWRRLEGCFSAGSGFVEGERGRMPAKDSRTVLLEALAATPPQQAPATQPVALTDEQRIDWLCEEAEFTCGQWQVVIDSDKESFLDAVDEMVRAAHGITQPSQQEQNNV